jgi:hypothetical protein
MKYANRDVRNTSKMKKQFCLAIIIIGQLSIILEHIFIIECISFLIV